MPEGPVRMWSTSTERPARRGEDSMARQGTQVVQRTEGEGTEGTHVHPARVHTHDHYHVSHHHKDGVLGEWEHRTYWHTHEHNHTELTHSHDYSQQDEEANHAKEAHIHDHTAPTTSPA